MRRFWSDPFATRRSRLLSFFLLYVGEGVPSGFTTTAVATQMRRLGVGPAEIGSFVAALYLPWAIKWAFGPFVDTFAPRRFGPRRFWIVLTQFLMVVTLLAAMPLDFAAQLKLFTVFLFVHNLFAATQDVAIDALAVNVLPPAERGVANGFMFGGSAIGQGLGGGGVLWLTSIMPFRATWLFVAGAVFAIGVLVSWRIRETAPDGTGEAPRTPAPAAQAGRRLVAFVRDAWRAFTGTRAAMLGVMLALLPMGATALGLALQSNLAVDLGLDDAQVGTLSLLSGLIGAVFCILGGWISDRYGRLRSVAVFIALMSLPTAALALALHAAGIAIPGAGAGAGAVPAAAVSAFWTCALLFAVFNGLMYGAGTAVYMDITTPRVAATQFTAYMALCNLAYALSAKWQGHAIERLGYPLTLGLDAVVGLVCLIVLPFVAVPRAATPEGVVR